MRYFTPESATRTLPLVERIVQDLLALQIDLVFRGERIDALGGCEGLSTSRAHADELADMRLSMQQDRVRIEAVLAELGKLGVMLHPSADGAVDFPAILNDREIRLCWKPGDETVKYWHEVDEPASKRRLITGTPEFSVSIGQETES